MPENLDFGKMEISIVHTTVKFRIDPPVSFDDYGKICSNIRRPSNNVLFYNCIDYIDENLDCKLRLFRNVLRCVGKTRAQNLKASETIFEQFRSKGHAIHVSYSADTHTVYKGKLKMGDKSFEKIAKEILGTSPQESVFALFQPKVTWSTRNHRYFFDCIYEPFRIVVKTLLLVNQRLKILRKDIILNVLIPILSEMEQNDTFGVSIKYQGCYIYANGLVQATDIRNPAALHAYFDQLKSIADSL